MVGTSGNALWRWSENTARARTPRPARPEMEAAANVTSPAISCGSNCGSPRNGIWVALTLAVCNSAEADRCGTEPTPVVPQLNLPGCAWPAATSSAIVL